ncbi:hypothetical protein FPT12_03200 [Pseudomonas sp. H3(2019)]|nr:hypothetical protein FPT12_03200 [Pseudomonas sp. H3(2019)]
MIEYEEKTKGFAELDERDKSALSIVDEKQKLLDTYKKINAGVETFYPDKYAEKTREIGPTAEETASANAINAKIREAAKERARTRLAGYDFDYADNLIVDKEKRTHYRLIGTEPKPITREMICSDLEKGSKDYKWCMGEIVGTPEAGCRNSYGDPCGSKYEKSRYGFTIIKE